MSDLDDMLRSAVGRNRVDPDAITPVADPGPPPDPSFGTGGWVNLAPGPSSEDVFRSALADAFDRATSSARLR